VRSKTGSGCDVSRHNKKRVIIPSRNMHAREKSSLSPNSTKKWIKKHPVIINAALLEHQQALLDLSCSQLREQWLNQELSELDRKQPVLSDYLKDFIKELLAICLEDLKLMNVPLLAGQYLIKYSVWAGNSFLIEGFIEKLLILRICDPLCPNSLRESAVTVLTVLHSLDILKTPDSYYPELEIVPNNRFVSTNKYLESFFKILNELIKSASLNIQPDIQIEDSNSDDMDENISHSDSDESSEEVSFSEELDPKDSLLECIIHSWCSLISLVSEDTFDNEFPGAYDIFNRLVRYHKNVTIKIVACEAIITLSDLNERLPLEKKYDIEIQPLVDLLHKYSNKTANTGNHKCRLIWLNLAKALEAEKCVVQLPFISIDQIQNKVSSPKNNKLDSRKQNQNKNVRETLWTNWTEAITVKFIKNSLGHLFNQLMSHNPEFGKRVLSLLENRDSWHLSYQNVPLSMVYIQITNTNAKLSSPSPSPKRSKNTDKLSTDWSKFNHITERH